MELISTKNLQDAINKIKKSKEKIKIIKAQSDDFNRKILEYGKFQVLLSPEKGNRKNRLRQINSGLNHVLAKIATKNKVSIGIDLKEISELQKKEKAERLAKIAQNIKTCRKTNTHMTVLNSKSKKEAQALLLSLGASTKQAKEASFFN